MSWQCQDVNPTAGKARTCSMSRGKMSKALYACSGTGVQFSGLAHNSGGPLLGARVRICDYASVTHPLMPPAVRSSLQYSSNVRV
jgi:hypothetical protein